MKCFQKRRLTEAKGHGLYHPELIDVVGVNVTKYSWLLLTACENQFSGSCNKKNYFSHNFGHRCPRKVHSAYPRHYLGFCDITCPFTEKLLYDTTKIHRVVEGLNTKRRQTRTWHAKVTSALFHYLPRLSQRENCGNFS